MGVCTKERKSQVIFAINKTFCMQHNVWVVIGFLGAGDFWSIFICSTGFLYFVFICSPSVIVHVHSKIHLPFKGVLVIQRKCFVSFNFYCFIIILLHLKASISVASSTFGGKNVGKLWNLPSPVCIWMCVWLHCWQGRIIFIKTETSKPCNN